MKAFVISLRVAAPMAALCCFATLSAAVGIAQTVTVSPDHLAFALSTNATPPTAAQTVTFSVTGEGSVTVGTVGISGANAGDFAIATDGCSGQMLTAPAACSVGVTFGGTMTSLEAASLNFPNNGALSPSVPLTGAAGAIKLFDPTIVAPSNGHATLSNPFTYGSTTLRLSCPAGEGAIAGKVSSTPDGSGYVLEDNYLTLSVNGTAASTGNHPDGNVCRGGPADDNDGTPLNDCFSTNYQAPAGAGNLNGQNPDSFANPDNHVLTAQDGNSNNAGGVPPIDVSTFLAAGTNPTTFTLLDGGGFVAGASLFLATNCTVAGVQSGGSIVSNPINPDVPGSQTPTFTFDSTAGQHIVLGANFLADPNSIAGNTVATVTDTGITQQQFQQLVAGTSAGPAVCLRLSGELDANGNPECKAFTIECTNSNPGADTPAGQNCPQSAIRDLLYQSRFDSPDTIRIDPFTGPGFLMGSDTWVSGGGNCTFTDPILLNQLCPEDLLTEFFGAGDPVPGGTTRGTNSTFVPVQNMPKPITVPIVTSENLFFWQRSTTVNVKFLVTPAIYPFFEPLPANGFKAAPIQSETYGTTPASQPVPSPVFPVPGDVTLFNPGGAGGSSTCPSAPGGIFTTSTSFTLPEGRFKLHYFATDCASTEELKFTPSSNPATNWASFKTVPVNIDMTAPSITGPSGGASSPTLSSPITPGKSVTVSFRCMDPNLADGSAGSGIAFCGPYLFLGVSDTGPLTTKFTASKTGHGSFTLKATDVAGNTVTQTLTY